MQAVTKRVHKTGNGHYYGAFWNKRTIRIFITASALRETQSELQWQIAIRDTWTP